MVLSLVQNLIFGFVKLIVFILGAIDSFGYWIHYKKHRILLANFVYGVLLFFLLSVYVVNQVSVTKIRKDLDLLPSAIAYEIYGSTSYDFSPSVGVLGVAHVKKPTLENKMAFPFISAKAHIVVDKQTGIVLSEHNINRTFAPASTTKLLTALVALDIYELDEKIKIPYECTQVESTKAWLPTDENFIVKDLVYSLLIGSAGDSSCALASSKVDKKEFIELMNNKADEYRMTNSNFTNYIGLDGENGSHYSSAWDLYLLAGKSMTNDIIKDAVKTKSFSFESEEGTKVNVTNTNKLLWEIPNSVGVKTGTTEGAGEVLIYEYKDDVRDLSFVVLGSTNRFDDTSKMLDWVLQSYTWN